MEWDRGSGSAGFDGGIGFGPFDGLLRFWVLAGE